MKKINDSFTNLPISKQRKYQLRHPELVKQRTARYMTLNREAILEKMRAYRLEHLEYFINYQKRYRKGTEE